MFVRNFYLSEISYNGIKNITEPSKIIRNSLKFTQHLNDNIYTFGPKKHIMQVLYFQKNGTHLNTIKIFYIHKEASFDNQLNYKHTTFPNIIFDTILKIKKAFDYLLINALLILQFLPNTLQLPNFTGPHYTFPPCSRLSKFT